MTPTSIVAYLTLFAATVCLFILASLFLGSLVRRQSPSAMKLETYECGEPAVGTTAVRFDLRFYVVALVFIIFEVEVALFFPPATIFGKATQLMNPRISADSALKLQGQLGMWETIPAPFYKLRQPRNAAEKRQIDELWREAARHMSETAGRTQAAADARLLAIAAMADLGAFFAVILVGFAYVWHRGDLDWVRAVGDRGEAAGSSASMRVLQL